MSGPIDKSPKDTFDELRLLVVDYAKQETVDPLKNLGKWVGFGFAGGLSIALGLILLGLGGLRFLQTLADDEGDVFNGFFSWAPYLILFAVLAVAIGLIVRAATKKPNLSSTGERV